MVPPVLCPATHHFHHHHHLHHAGNGYGTPELVPGAIPQRQSTGFPLVTSYENGGFDSSASGITTAPLANSTVANFAPTAVNPHLFHGQQAFERTKNELLEASILGSYHYLTKASTTYNSSNLQDTLIQDVKPYSELAGTQEQKVPSTIQANSRPPLRKRNVPTKERNGPFICEWEVVCF